MHSIYESFTEIKVYTQARFYLSLIDNHSENQSHAGIYTNNLGIPKIDQIFQLEFEMLVGFRCCDKRIRIRVHLRWQFYGAHCISYIL